MLPTLEMRDTVMASHSFLEIIHLKKYFPMRVGLFSTRYIYAVDDVSFALERGESLGLVGESGSGKSTVAKLAMRLIEPTEGAVHFMGRNILQMDKNSLRKVRQEMAMIFQDPSSALDPKMTVKDLVNEPLKLTGHKKEVIVEKVARVLDLVNLPHSYLDRYPHELSGGEKQRVGIARALITNPRLVIADEPTSALDVSIQAQILELVKNLVKDLEVTLLFISHDLAVVKHVCNEVAVMYMGKIMELGSAKNLLRKPLHPYTRALCSAVPEPNSKAKERVLLKDSPQYSTSLMLGCKFNARCPIAEKKCAEESPKMVEVKLGRFVACHFV